LYIVCGLLCVSVCSVYMLSVCVSVCESV